jgi:hypothetical protein
MKNFLMCWESLGRCGFGHVGYVCFVTEYELFYRECFTTLV